MTDTAILDQITEILRDILEDPALQVTPETTAKMVPGWDSMVQVKLLMAIEESFGVHFSSREMDRLHNVGDLIEIVARHAGESS